MATRPDELTRFLRESLARGIPRTDIERALLEAGWHTEQVKKALAGFADVAFPLPVPRPVHHLSAGEAFLYLVLFTALGTSAYSIAEIAFNLIEFLLYDPAQAPLINMNSWLASVRWAVARVVIAFPVFLLASYWTARALARDPAERSSPIRRWLTYAAMFVAVCVIIGDLVTLVAYVLSGETTSRFLLKVVVVATIAGAILGYYLYDLRESGAAKRPVARALLAVSIAAALAAIVGGLWLVGSPAEQAARRIDDRRIQELKSIAGAVDVYFERNARLPQDLGELTTALQSNLATTDPETGASYNYRGVDARSYELCAMFARPSESVTVDAAWTHGEGQQCFPLKVREMQPSSP